ncbi:MAG: N-acetylneuraminate synthase family protein [Methyloversatilis sp.]|uniref:N-acetylneuraminate synthase family protein n=1 Tax=Methyloversatilis sp. TaxID=2569862 RepID=UPI002735328D|nr:N-acetylneuraminate synthase family protein [Methyloversatilis sp.]MDP3871362.1 N-acetylneuraminate synthase family protein [Methyloversatilis sp.]
MSLGPDLIGGGHPPLFWPDIDVYFQRDLNQAFRLIDKIAEAGGRYLKGAVLHRESLCLKNAGRVSYYDKSKNEAVSEPFENVIARHVVPLESLRKVMNHARDTGLNVVLSVYDTEGLAFAKAVGALAVKIPSSNITHKALIDAVAESELPMVIDTGRSKFREIERAVGWARQKGAGARLVIQHSPPGPPAHASRFHLRMMPYMSEVFSCPVGLSDHHSGLAMLSLAVALGASVVEKGLVVDDAQTDIDVAHALPVSRLREALTILDESWCALGESIRPDAEAPASPVDRMCIIARRGIAEGEVITWDALDFAFPPVGIGAEEIDSLLGARAIVPISCGESIKWADISVAESGDV